MLKLVETRLVNASHEDISRFSREELRKVAKELGIERGRNKIDTIVNLMRSGRVKLLSSIEIVR